MSANVIDTKLIRKNWQISTRVGSADGLYALTLLDISGTNFGNKNRQIVKEFVFRVNPKSISVDEPPAVVITPTQAGQYIEHRGQIYKNITISGTTGLRPNKKQIAAVFGIVNPFANVATNKDTGLPQEERTGFDDLLDLRNLFRYYCDLKEDQEFASKVVMVWQNGKEGEYYIVEPINFKTNRDSGSPLTTNFEIQLRTIEPLDITRIIDTEQKPSDLGFFGKLKKFNHKLAVALAVIEALVDRTATVSQAAITAVYAPLNTLLQGLTGIVRSSQRFLTIPRNTIRTLMQNVVALKLAVEGYKDELNAYKQNGVKSMSKEYGKALTDCVRVLGMIYMETKLFAVPFSTAVTQKANVYSTPFGPMVGTGPTNLNNAKVTNNTSQAVVHRGEDIKSAALRLLGDAAEWKTLVILNKLKSPYIDVAGDGINVLRPGDSILYPSTSGSALRGNNSAVDTRIANSTPVDDGLGVDLKLVPTLQGLGVYYDFAIEAGDLALVSGTDNMVQAVIARAGTEQGSLPTHPSYGLRFPIGTKAKVRTLLEFHINAKASLLADPRIGSVDNFSAVIDGNTLIITANLVINNTNESLPIGLNIRR